MGVSFELALENVEEAADEIFASDSTVRSVGITRHGDSFGFRAVRNAAIPVAFGTGAARIDNFQEIPVVYKNTFGELKSMMMVPGKGPASPSAASLIPEVNRHRPLVCGLQIQNFDDDDRQGVFDEGFIVIGTLGCFVRLGNDRVALLSNNHVVAGENRGQRNSDRILQPGSDVFDIDDQIAVLTEFVDLQTSPPGLSRGSSLINYNEIDAGVAELVEEISFNKGYLPFRNLIAPVGTARARAEDEVFKVGRTTGLTFGVVKDVGAIVGPVSYDPGECWFRRSLVIEGRNGTQFSDRGDSGSAIVRTNGEVVGILYAGNGDVTYACPIETVLNQLNCSLV
jgi:S1-C subfamily serine protease